MNYLKTFFITTILLSTSIIFNAPYDNGLFAYTTEQPTEIPETISSVPTVPIEEIPITEVIAQKTALEEWKAHLDTLGKHWDKTNNIPDDEWKKECFRLAENVLKQDKSASDTLRSDFFTAINQQTTEITPAIFGLIKELDEIIASKLPSLETTATKEATPPETTKATPVEEKKEETSFESLPAPAENISTSVTPESSTAQTSATTTTTSEAQSEDQLLQQWNDLIAAIKKPGIKKDEANETLDKVNELVGQLKNKKTTQKLKEDFDEVCLILKLKNILHPADLKIRQELFDRALFPEGYQQAQQFEQNLYQQQLTAEQNQKIEEELQKFREEMAAKEAIEKEKREKSEKQIQAALAKAKEENKISEEKARNLAQIAKSHTEQLGANASARFDAERSTKEKETREAFLKTMQQKTTTAKKLAEEQKAEQGIFNRAIKAVTDVASNVKDWWYGSSTAPTQAPTTLTASKEQEDKEIEELTNYLETGTKYIDKKYIIISLWENFQKFLRKAPQHLDQYSIEFNKPWISNVEHILTELIITHNIITIDQACDKIKNAFPESDYAAQIVRKIKMDLEYTELQANKQKQQEAEHRSQLAQKRQERKEQIMLAQQRVKDEEDRIEAEKKKQLIATDDYKNHKKEWQQLLAQLSQNTQATAEENHAHTTEAIKKSHSLLQLAHTIPSKDKQAVSQKLKQKFTVALLDQQRLNDTKLNIHHNMDHFNNEINKLIE